MKKTIALLALLASSGAIAAHAAGAAATGWISDSMCGAKHAGTGAACAKKCIEGGEKPVFVDEGKKDVWAIENPDAVKGHYGDKVKIEGTTNAANKTVHIDSVAEAK
jgi:hypothetical protein